MAVGQVKNAFNRTYISICPDPAKGPETWVLALPQVYNDDSGVGNRGSFEFLTMEPVEQSDRLLENGNTEITTFLDFTTLVDITTA